ncbi:hypothetical protein [Azospirillum endophyticum]
MSDQRIIVPKASDRDVMAFFQDISQILNHKTISIRHIGSPKQNEIQISNNFVESHKRDANTIFQVTLGVNGYAVTFYNGTSSNPPSYGMDEIKFSYSSNSNNVNDSIYVGINESIRRNFFSGDVISVSLFNDPKVLQDAISSHHSIIAKLENALLSITEDLSKKQLELQEHLAEEKKKLEVEYHEKKEHLDSQNKDQLEQLNALKDELENRKKDLDDRDNTHARRQIRNDLKNRIKDHSENFQLTRGTKNLRTPIHLSAIASLLVIGVLLYKYGSIAASSTNSALGTLDITIMIIKPLGLTVAFLGLLTWYLRWMNRWFERHAEAEFQLKQFELDIDRASWVVESALEWKQAQNSAMPDHIIESISRNLFTKSDKDEGADMHPADYLASALLGRASSLKLNVGGHQIEYDKKALRDTAQSTQASQKPNG